MSKKVPVYLSKEELAIILRWKLYFTIGIYVVEDCPTNKLAIKLEEQLEQFNEE